MKKIISVIGARPNFMKMAPVHRALSLKKEYFTHLICHTGQHFEKHMSDIFFKELAIPTPNYNLGINSGSHALQTARVMVEFEKICQIENPDLIIVYGDINSTMACSIVAKKLQIQLAHVESGLRSFDRMMPEEINRLITDSISDYLFVTEKSGVKNLKNDGVPSEKIIFVGNTMIDTLIRSLPLINKSDILKRFEIEQNKFILVTFHRPSNVDFPLMFEGIITFLNNLGDHFPVIFPIHPRSCQNLKSFGLNAKISNRIILTDSLGYYDFLRLVSCAFMVVTDSGGIQEETTYLKIPCLTLRTTTERPVTIEEGTNILCGEDYDYAMKQAKLILLGTQKQGNIPKYWDGKAAERIVAYLIQKLN